MPQKQLQTVKTTYTNVTATSKKELPDQKWIKPNHSPDMSVTPFGCICFMNTPSNTWLNGPWPKSWHKPIHQIKTIWEDIYCILLIHENSSATENYESPATLTQVISLSVIPSSGWFDLRNFTNFSARCATPRLWINLVCVAPRNTRSHTPSCFNECSRWNSGVSIMDRQSPSILMKSWIGSLNSFTLLQLLFLTLALWLLKGEKGVAVVVDWGLST